MKAGKDESMQALRIPLLPIEVGIMDGDSTRGTRSSSAIASWRARENNFGTANQGMTGEKTTRENPGLGLRSHTLIIIIGSFFLLPYQHKDYLSLKFKRRRERFGRTNLRLTRVQ